uniref:Cystatin domain-containing protein n=1 Tax=Strongyloides venezuelensis TaxID=75913 RepID=A0A0K0G4F2_STRVS
MNFFKVFIFIIFTFVLTTKAFNIFSKQKSYNLWSEKNPTSGKLKKLAEKSVDYYNKEHGSKYFFDSILRAGKEYVDNLTHYFLKILAATKCGISGDTCSEIFYVNVYDNKTRFSHKYNFSVDTNGTAPFF